MNGTVAPPSSSATAAPTCPSRTPRSAAYFRAGQRTPTVDEIARYYRERRLGAVVFTVDAEGFTGHPPPSGEEIARAAAEHDDVLIPFASVDPAKGKAGARLLRRLLT